MIKTKKKNHTKKGIFEQTSFLNTNLAMILSFTLKKVLKLYKWTGQMLNRLTKTSMQFCKNLTRGKSKMELHENNILIKVFHEDLSLKLLQQPKIQSILSIYNLCCTMCNHLLSATKNCTLLNSNDIWKCTVLISSCLKVNHRYSAASIHGSTYLHCQDNLHGDWLF